MAAVKKIRTMWRNSAILMLINGPFRYRRPTSNDLASVLGKRTLPIFLENTDEHCKDDMNLLFVQRHARSGFMVIFVCV